MPQSVNKTILAPGGRADDSYSGAAVLGLGDNKRSRMPREDEDVCAALFSSEEEAGERRQAASLPPSSAKGGSGNDADGNAKA